MWESLVLALALGGPSGPKVELRPLQRVTVLGMGQCSVEVKFVLTVEPRGDEDYYCPRVEWEWEDDHLPPGGPDQTTRSVEESDCVPYEPARHDRQRQT